MSNGNGGNGDKSTDVTCPTCGGAYKNPQRDGTAYVHTCPDWKRNGGGVPVLVNPKATLPPFAIVRAAVAAVPAVMDGTGLVVVTPAVAAVTSIVLVNP
jgi:hypothetical protein